MTQTTAHQIAQNLLAETDGNIQSALYALEDGAYLATQDWTQDEVEEAHDILTKTNIRRSYVIRQKFESLGDACAEMFETISEAETAAAKLRDEITTMVAGWDTPDPDDYVAQFSSDEENSAWEHALMLADGNRTYGREAGAYIADEAVEIAEVVENQNIQIK